MVLALAKTAQLPADVAVTVQRMAETAKRIDEIKEAGRKDALAAAIASLDRLKLEQPEAYQELLLARTKSTRNQATTSAHQ